MGSFLGFLFYSTNLHVCSYASNRRFWLQWPCNIVWYQVLWSLLLCSSFSKLLWLFGSFTVPYKFLKCVFYIYEICHWYFYRDYVESINFSGHYGHSDVVNSSSPWTWYMLPFVCVFLNFIPQCCVVLWVKAFNILV